MKSYVNSVSTMRAKNGFADKLKWRLRARCDKFFLVLVTGLFIRLLIAPYTTFSATWENVHSLDTIFIFGFNPLSWITSYGFGFYLFYSPMYLLYLILNFFGVSYPFLLGFLLKLPSILGDIISFYALYGIVQLISQDPKKSLGVATTYFLNPFTIFFSAVTGHFDQLMMAFVLLSLLFLIKKRIGYSAACLSIATSFRYLPVLILPAFLVYLWRIDKSFFSRAIKYFITFSISLLAVFAPFFSVLIPLYLSSHSVFWTYIGHFFSPASPENSALGLLAPISPENPAFQYGFAGVLTTLGLWESLSAFFNVRIFLLLYLFATVIILKRGSPSIHLISRYTVVVFALFMVIIPLNQHYYLTWIFPFLLMESLVFHSLPRYHPHILWISNLVIFPIIRGHFLVWFDHTFTLGLGSYWIFYNLPLILSTSVLYGSFLILTILACTHIRK